MIEIKFDENNNKSIAYDKNIQVGECYFIEIENTWNIIHTEVNNSYQGQGIAKKLVLNIIVNAEKHNKKIIADCSYANKVLEKINKNLIAKLTDEDIGEKFIELENPEIRLAARGVVIREDGKIALFNKTNKNEYKLPGGGIEGEETPEEAFKREVLEETGCRVEIINKLGITEEYKTQTNFKQISHVFVGKVLEDTHQLNVTEKEKEEGAELLWEYPEKALDLIKNCYDKLVASKYESVYKTKFIILRDSKILEKYIGNEKVRFN